MPSVLRLNIREQTGLPCRSWALLTKTVMIVVQMGYYGPRRIVPGLNNAIRTCTISIRICGSTTRPPARCWRRSNCRPTPPARRITYMAGGKQFIVFPVGGGPLVEEMIAVSL